MRISGEGGTIVVRSLKDGSETVYTIDNMPSKYYSVYNYAFNVLDLIKSKIPKCKFENKYGKFMLMKNLPFPNFEAEFTCGTKLLH